jgi:hypothetical protein
MFGSDLFAEQNRTVWLSRKSAAIVAIRKLWKEVVNDKVEL